MTKYKIEEEGNKNPISEPAGNSGQQENRVER